MRILYQKPASRVRRYSNFMTGPLMDERDTSAVIDLPPFPFSLFKNFADSKQQAYTIGWKRLSDDYKMERAYRGEGKGQEGSERNEPS